MDKRSLSVNWKDAFRLLLLLLIFICILLAIYLPSNYPREMLIAGTVWTAVLLLWITEILPLAVSGLIGCWTFYVIGRALNISALSSNAFSGFGEITLWFIFAGLILGVAVKESGLAELVAKYIIRHFNKNFKQLLFGMLCAEILLTLIVPSGDAVTVIMVSMALGIITAYQGGPHSNIGKCLMIMPAISVSVLDKAILSGASAITTVGMIESIGGQVITYSKWYLYMLPAQFILFIWTYFTVLKLFPPGDEHMKYEGPAATERLTLTPQQIKTIIWTGAGLLLWFTDSITRIRPDIIGIGIALGLLLPSVGVVTLDELRHKVNWPIIVFLGTAFSLVNVIEGTGLTRLIFNNLLTRIPLAEFPMWLILLLIALMSMVLHLFTGHTTTLVAGFLPIILSWGVSFGIPAPPLAFAFLWGAAGEFLIYQSSAFMIAYSYGYFTAFDLMKAALVEMIGIFVSVVLMAIFWWQIVA